ncbi:MAG: ATP-binding protein [Methylorubrum populi]
MTECWRGSPNGIYRQPSSALRELISNAYDADATEVYIDTDAPRYNRIEVRDNGRRMDEEALSRLIHHIGGSSKRTSFGKNVGTTSQDDATLSPGGRRLIGKIGIGLFSVSQLTSHFQIITKIEGRDYRLVADVILRTYVEDDASEAETFETGKVRVLAVAADDVQSHGTQIILRQLHPRARNILRSKERWDRYYEQQALDESERDPAVSRPAYHIGVLEKEPDPADGALVFKEQPALPWKDGDAPLAKFEKLRDALSEQVGTATERPELAITLDTYLTMLWALSLAAPLEYLGKHPFDLTQDDDPAPYLLTNARGRAAKIELKHGERIRDATGLTARAEAAAGGFKVFVDGVELRRPVTFGWWPSERQAIKNPLIFVGRYAPDLSKIPASVRGGELEFEAYLFWNSKVVPKENNGVLVRINGASGALFDDTFMKYQVSEQTRLRQTTAEIFVTKGLDAALNIDRESFNFAHPHYVLLSNWLHRALRQLANTQKALAEAIRVEQSQERKAEDTDRLNRFVEQSWHSARKDSTERPPSVEVVTSLEAAAIRRQQGIIALDRTKLPAANPAGKNAAKETVEREQKLRAVATILDGFGVLGDMPYDEQHRLLDAILTVFFNDAQP